MDSREITQEAFLEWAHHPVTELVKRALHQQVEEVKERWSRRTLFNQLDSQTLITQADALGKVDAYRSLIELDYEGLKMALEGEGA